MRNMSTNWKRITAHLTIALLTAMWSYAVLSKLIDCETAKRAMHNQIFAPGLSDVLTWLIPLIELFISGLLLFKPTQRLGLKLSAGLLTLFIFYIAIVMNAAFGRVPCSCGGIISELSYGEHLVFNVVFLLLALASLWLTHRSERKTVPMLNERRSTARKIE